MYIYRHSSGHAKSLTYFSKYQGTSAVTRMHSYVQIHSYCVIPRQTNAKKKTWLPRIWMKLGSFIVSDMEWPYWKYLYIKGYLLPTWAEKITWQYFNWMLQSSSDVSKLFSELKLVTDNLLFIYAWANWEATESQGCSSWMTIQWLQFSNTVICNCNFISKQLQQL